MSVRPILLYGQDLRSPCAEVTEFGESLKPLIADLFDTLWKQQGVGLAAPQIGVFRRIAVIDFMAKRKSVKGEDEQVHEKWILVNPVIEEASGVQKGAEGCLSAPGFQMTVLRPAEVVCRFQDEFGEWRRIVAEGLLARAIAHETDHLNSVTIVDRVRGVTHDMFNRRWAKMSKRGFREGYVTRANNPV